MSDASSLMQFAQTGTITGWSLVIIGLVGVWKLTAIVPSLMVAWEKRNDGIEARLRAAMTDYTERMDAQLEQADRAHKLCQEDQEKLRQRVNEQDLVIATQNKTIAELTGTNVKLSGEVSALKASHLQTQMTFVEEKPGTTENVKSAIRQLREIK